MADDIDIEEHDVLADVQAKVAFGDISFDLSLVKSEPLEFIESMEYPTEYKPKLNPEDVRKTPSPPPSTSTVSDPPGPDNPDTPRDPDNPDAPPDPANPDIPEAVPDSTTDISPSFNRTTDSPHIVSSTQEVPNNCIILGNKPRYEAKCFQSYILIEDWGAYLSSSESYCRDCEILFPTINALDAHKMTTHSYLVAVSELSDPEQDWPCPMCDKVFSTRKILAQHERAKHAASASTGSSVSVSVPTKSCFVCHATFESGDDLVNHVYEHLSAEKEAQGSPSVKSDAQPSRETGYQCRVCKYCFKNTAKFQQHCLKMHGGAQPLNRVPFDLSCALCAKVMSSYSSLNDHLSYNHLKAKPNTLMYKCSLSGEVFLNMMMKLKHTTMFHPDSACLKSFRDSTDSYRSVTRLVPISVAFQCANCDTHFAKLAATRSHDCGATDATACDKCDRLFAADDAQTHQSQHLLANDVISVVVDDGTVDRVLLHCPVCDVVYSEQRLYSHVGQCKGPSPDVFHCDCQRSIDKSLKLQHEKSHALTATDDEYIDVRFEYIVSAAKKSESRAVAVAKQAPISSRRVPQITPREFYVIAYCRHCKLCFHGHNKNKVHPHVKKLCVNHTGMCVCRICGLAFGSVSSVGRHYARHRQMASFDFNRYQFFDIVTEKTVRVPAPSYKYCKMHRMHSVLNCAARRSMSTCDGATRRIHCSLCNKTFSATAYKLHMNFHNYTFKGKPLTFAQVKAMQRNKGGDAVAKQFPKKGVRPRGDATMGLTSKGKYIVYFCPKCRAYTPNRTPHFNNTCTTKAYDYCHGCGMYLDARQIADHRQLHRQGKDLNDFEVMHWKRCQPVAPPPPTFHKGPKCGINFLSKRDSLDHACKDDEPFKYCAICREPFSPRAFKVHNMYHSYVSGGIQVKPKDCHIPIGGVGPRAPLPATAGGLFRCNSCTGVYAPKQYAVHKTIAYDCSSLTRYLDKCDTPGCDMLFFGPTLKKHATHSGRKIVDFLPDKLPVPQLYECRHCNVHLASRNIERHDCSDASKLSKRLGVKLSLSVDERQLKTANIDDITVYRFDRRGVDQLPKDFTKPFTCYKCSKCSMFLGTRPMALHHLKRKCTGKRPKDAIFCEACNLHCRLERTHNLWHNREGFTNDNINWLDVNQEMADWVFKLSQCLDCNYMTGSRNILLDHMSKCTGQAGRMRLCDTCHLAHPVLYGGVHLAHHVSMTKLGASTLRVLPYSCKVVEAPVGDNKRVYYQCQKCLLCLSKRSLESHPRECTEQRALANHRMCTDCGHIFHNTYMPKHAAKHEREHFTGVDIKLIPFREKTVKKVKDKEAANRKRKAASVKMAVMYKCACGLSFLSGEEAGAHAQTCDGSGAGGSQCSKCEFVLNSKDLFKHSLTHHRREEYEFAIEHVAPKKAAKYDYSYAYKCTACGVYYLNNKRIHPHVETCDGSNEEAEFCRVCNVMVACDLAWHLRNHRRLDKCTVIYKSPAVNRTLLQCKPCDVLFMTPAAADEHARNNHAVEASECPQCGLRINHGCLPSHTETHHVKLKVMKGSFVIKPHVSANPKCAPNKLNRCLDCDVYFVGSRDFHKHLARKDFTEYEVCAACDVRVYLEHYSEHSSNHLASLADYEIVEGRHKVVEEDIEPPPPPPPSKHSLQLTCDRINRLIHCALCGIHFFKHNTFFTHDCGTLTGVECDLCGLVFSAKKLVAHTEIHHRQLKLDAKHFDIISFGDLKEQSVSRVQTAIRDDAINEHLTRLNLKHYIYYDAICDLYFTHLASYRAHVSASHKSQKIQACHCGRKFLESEMRVHAKHHARRLTGFRVTLNGNANEYILQDNMAEHWSGVNLYKCVCGTHFADKQECVEHMAGRCLETAAECPQCHLKFTRGFMTTHSDRHHDKTRTIDQFFIVPIDGRGVKKEDDVNIDSDNGRLFACAACNLNFLTEADVEFHSKQADSSAEITVACEECNLMFYEDAQKHHARTHHNRRNNLTRADLLVVKSQFSCAASVAVDAKMEIDTSKIKKELDDSIDTSKIKKEPDDSIYTSRIKNEPMDDSSVNNDDAESMDEPNVATTAKNEPSKRKYLIKYYKCKACNVHFMRQGLCYKHAVDHKAMEAWDFVECKICSLNFKVDAIAYHMSIHKSKNFSPKDVLIEEYVPLETKHKKGTPVINLYYGDEVTEAETEDVPKSEPSTQGTSDDSSRVKADIPNDDAITESNANYVHKQKDTADNNTNDQNTLNNVETELTLPINANSLQDSLSSSVDGNVSDEIVNKTEMPLTAVDNNDSTDTEMSVAVQSLDNHTECNAVVDSETSAINKTATPD